jgi:hypothetical protein
MIRRFSRFRQLRIALYAATEETTCMRRILSLLALLPLLLAGCSSMDFPGSAMYFSNKPGGPPFLKFTPGVGAPMLAIYDGTQWTPERKMDVLKLNEPPITFTPELAPLLKAAYRIDSYLLLVFKPGAKVRGETLPSQYFLQPGGFAYVVPAPKAR